MREGRGDYFFIPNIYRGFSELRGHRRPGTRQEDGTAVDGEASREGPTTWRRPPPVDGDGGRQGLARRVTETAALWKSATEGSCDRKEESAVGGVRVAEDTDDLVMAAQEQAEDDEQNQNPDVDERDAENLAHLVQFAKNLVRPGLVRAEGQAAAPPRGREHHLAVRHGG